MSLTAGTRFGTFEIVAPLGAGGMGEVYRARDSKLKRDVALKFLYTSDNDELMSVPITGTDSYSSPPARLFRPCDTSLISRLPMLLSAVTYDGAPGGRRFLFTCAGAGALPSSIVVSVNWSAAPQ